MLDSIGSLLHNALPHLSYVLNMFNRILSVISSMWGIEIPPVGATTTQEPDEEEA